MSRRESGSAKVWSESQQPLDEDEQSALYAEVNRTTRLDATGMPWDWLRRTPLALATVVSIGERLVAAVDAAVFAALGIMTVDGFVVVVVVA